MNYLVLRLLMLIITLKKMESIGRISYMYFKKHVLEIVFCRHNLEKHFTKDKFKNAKSTSLILFWNITLHLQYGTRVHKTIQIYINYN